MAEWTVTGDGFTMDGSSGEWMGMIDTENWALVHWFLFITSGFKLPSRKWVVSWVEWEHHAEPGTFTSMVCAAKFIGNAEGPAAEYEVTNWAG